MSKYLTFALLLLTSIALAPLTACAPQGFTVNLRPAENQFEEVVVIAPERSTRNKVALIDVSGVIANADTGGLFGGGANPVSEFAEQLAKAERDDRVKAILIRIDSPGGSVMATEAMFQEAVRFKAKTGKPVVAQMMTTAASGGFFLACAADEVWAYHSTVTGSIGVIMQLVSVKPALDRWGVEATTIASGANKPAGSPLTQLEDAQREVFASLVDEFYAGFVAVVRERRPDLTDDEIATLADGRVLSGQQAQAAGLIDRVGTLRESAARAAELAGLDRANLVRYRRPLTYVGSPYATAPAGAPVGEVEVNLVQLQLDGVTGPTSGFYYLWAPGLLD
ncbi:MAG: signal peptide peptidase SppA [Planctomycetota bacterium]